MKSITFCLSLLLIFLPFTLLYASEKQLTVLTPNNVIGWELDETYIASNADSLMARINGGAPFYLDRGSKEVLFQEYTKGRQYVSLELYRMSDRKSAKILYHDINEIKPEPLTNIGTEGRFDGSLVGNYLVEFHNKNFFIRLMISQKSPASKKTILKFASIISGKIDELK